MQPQKLSPKLELTKLIGRKDLSFGCLLRTTKYHSKKNNGKIVRFAFIPESRDGTTKEDIELLKKGKFFGSIKCVNDCGIVEQLDCARWGDIRSGEEWERYNDNIEIIGHPATLTDFHNWIIKQVDTCGNRALAFSHLGEQIMISPIWIAKTQHVKQIPYDSSKDLLDQNDETLKQIIDLIKGHK